MKKCRENGKRTCSYFGSNRSLSSGPSGLHLIRITGMIPGGFVEEGEALEEIALH